MPTKSTKQPTKSKKQDKSNTTSRRKKRQISSPEEQEQEKQKRMKQEDLDIEEYEDSEEIDASSSNSSSSDSSPRIDMKNLLKTLESQSKQKLIKKQNKTFEEIKFNLNGILLSRLNDLIKDQETEFEQKVTSFFKFKNQTEAQRDKYIDQVIQQQELLKEIMSQLESNLLNHLEELKLGSTSTIQNISHLNSSKKL